ncbi:MAG: hypothetical protein ACOX3E_00710 [Desulfomonilia bacterium]
MERDILGSAGYSLYTDRNRKAFQAAYAKLLTRANASVVKAESFDRRGIAASVPDRRTMPGLLQSHFRSIPGTRISGRFPMYRDLDKKRLFTGGIARAGRRQRLAGQWHNAGNMKGGMLCLSREAINLIHTRLP